MKTWLVSYKREDPEGVEWHEVEHDIEAEDAKGALLRFLGDYGIGQADDLNRLTDAHGDSVETEHMDMPMVADVLLAGGTASFLCGTDEYEFAGDNLKEDHSRPCPLCRGKGRVLEQDQALVGCD